MAKLVNYPTRKSYLIGLLGFTALVLLVGVTTIVTQKETRLTSQAAINKSSILLDNLVTPIFNPSGVMTFQFTAIETDSERRLVGASVIVSNRWGSKCAEKAAAATNRQKETFSITTQPIDGGDCRAGAVFGIFVRDCYVGPIPIPGIDCLSLRRDVFFGPYYFQPSCSAGETRCNGTVAEYCAGGSWQKHTDCNEYGWQCSTESGKAQCVASCKEAETRCNGTVAEFCTGGKWQKHTDCSEYGSGWSCSTDSGSVKCIPACTPGSTRCNGTKVELCGANAAWETYADCSNYHQTWVCLESDAKAKCGPPDAECDPGSTRCNGSKVEYCDWDGKWKQYVDCAAGIYRLECTVISGKPYCTVP